MGLTGSRPHWDNCGIQMRRPCLDSPSFSMLGVLPMLQPPRVSLNKGDSGVGDDTD